MLKKDNFKQNLKAFFQKYKHAWVLLYVFIYFPWFTYLEKHVTSNFNVIHTALDDKIPFIEFFIVPYMLWFGYVAYAVLYFFFKNKEGLLPALYIPVCGNDCISGSIQPLSKRTLSPPAFL